MADWSNPFAFTCHSWVGRSTGVGLDIDLTFTACVALLPDFAV